MNAEWVMVGIILLGGMTAAGISLRLKRRKEAQALNAGNLDNTNLQEDQDKSQPI